MQEMINYSENTGGDFMTELRLLGAKDEKRLLEYIEQYTFETAFLYANVKQFGVENDGQTRRCANYYGLFEGESLLGVLPFYNLGSCIPHFIDARAIPIFAKKMKETHFDCLLGMNQLVGPLVEALKPFKEAIKDTDDSYYINQEFKPYRLQEIEIVSIHELPLDQAIAFHREMNLVGFGRETSDEEAQKALNEKGDEEAYLVILKDGKCLASANIQTYTGQIAQIGGVYTAPEHRGNGYAKAVVSALCDIIIKSGKMPTLMVTKANTPAVKAYQALGFKHYDDYRIVSYQ